MNFIEKTHLYEFAVVYKIRSKLNVIFNVKQVQLLGSWLSLSLLPFKRYTYLVFLFCIQVVSSNEKKVKRLHPLPPAEIKDPMVFGRLHWIWIFCSLHGFPGRISNARILGMHCIGGESTRGSFSREPDRKSVV